MQVASVSDGEDNMPECVVEIAIPEVGGGVGVDRVGFLMWGSYHPKDVSRGGQGDWKGGAKDNGAAFIADLRMGATYTRHESGALKVTMSALSLASYFDGKPATANVFPEGGLSMERVEEMLDAALRRMAGATMAAHFMDGMRCHRWAWHRSLRTAVDAGGKPREPFPTRPPTRFFGINELEITADSFTPKAPLIVDAMKLIQGRGKKTPYATTAYVTKDLKGYLKDVQLREKAGAAVRIVTPEDHLRLELRVTSTRRGGKPSGMERLAGLLPEAGHLDGVPLYLRPGQVVRRYLDAAVLRGVLVDEIRQREGEVVSVKDLPRRLRRPHARFEKAAVGEVLAAQRGMDPDDRRLLLRAIYWSRIEALGMTSLADAVPAAERRVLDPAREAG